MKLRRNKQSEKKSNLHTDKTESQVHSSLDENIDILKELFEDCSDVIYRTFKVGSHQACIIFIDGLIDANSIQFHVLDALEEASRESLSIEIVKDKIVSIGSVKETEKLDAIVKDILSGNTGLLIDGLNEALIVDAKGGSRRSVAEPETETVIRGPREGFTESLRVNTALVRHKIRSNRLKMIAKTVGEETQTNIAILYVDGLARPELVKEVMARIEKIEIDAVLESGYIEELIEDNSWSLFPQIQNTERPDTLAANLLEGRVGVIVDGTPFALILPTTFWQFLQASEDYYHRFHISVFLRVIRVIFIFLALELPAIYIAVTTYHQEMLPTNLLFSVASSREAIPFPAFIEALIMEVAFEALREAGIRLPKVIGQAVSILGALVIGQAAVEAGIVSAPMVIIVSLTGIASFTIPRFNMAISIRLLRFPIMILAGVFGLYGIVLGSTFILTHLCKLRSFGVPYFSPLGPLNLRELRDVFIRAPWWALDKRPSQTVKDDVRRQKENVRPTKKQRSGLEGGNA
ncbi:spore germination protein KA/spore germination protein [Mesobacillus persicus]|uniref:Spore germination protein KA/spore germination protein n=1 Tax=Mesobacillus persicus TaxID=930146 RepID=A0A1H8ERG6_9BACI|nr:spore germination protein [Mesobacillus persicus]SEN21724.1 spore germination protein KA/spore germination protein [Mesobacillus persicus]